MARLMLWRHVPVWKHLRSEDLHFSSLLVRGTVSTSGTAHKENTEESVLGC